MKILNGYAGIGGNRKLWGNEHQITAIEYNKDIAEIYGDLYPNDTVIVTDAHEYLLNHVRLKCLPNKRTRLTKPN